MKYETNRRGGNAIAILKIIMMIAIAYMALDFIGLIGWVASGQHPADGCYLGAISAHILGAFF